MYDRDDLRETLTSCGSQTKTVPEGSTCPYTDCSPSVLTEANEPAVSTNKPFWAHSLPIPEAGEEQKCWLPKWGMESLRIWTKLPFFLPWSPPLFIFFPLSLCFFFSPTSPSPAACSSKCLLNSSPGTRWLWGFCSQRFKFRKTRVWEEHEEHCSQVQPRRNESQFPAHFLEESSIFESEVSEPFQLVFIYSKMVQWLFL